MLAHFASEYEISYGLILLTAVPHVNDLINRFIRKMRQVVKKSLMSHRVSEIY